MGKQTVKNDALEVDYKRKGDIGKQLPPSSAKQQDLEGFDADYVDIVDFIVRGTHRIWEEGGLGIIYNNYQHDVTIWTSDGLAYGRDVVIANSAQTQSAFPDGLLICDDVIWAGNAQDGFHTSHRIHWVGHNTGYTVYGPPTGRRIVRSGTGNCYIRANRIIEEWIARDEISLVYQLGYDPNEIGERWAQAHVSVTICRSSRPGNRTASWARPRRPRCPRNRVMASILRTLSAAPSTRSGTGGYSTRSGNTTRRRPSPMQQAAVICMVTATCGRSSSP